jgi:septum site-determining protein MinC
MQRLVVAATTAPGRRQGCRLRQVNSGTNEASFVAIARFSSSSNAKTNVEAARSYLEAWVGGNTNSSNKHLDKNTNNRSSHGPTTISPRHRAAAMTNTMRGASSPLILSSSSYLLATLRLEKLDTPESIAARLQQQEEHSEDHLVVQYHNKQWKVPVVLDLRAWCPDGSPHYQPKPPGTLKQLTVMLDRYGLSVVGLNGIPKELQPEATEELALPSLFLSSTGKSSGSAGTPAASNYLQLEDVIQMVAQRQAQEEPIEIVPSPSTVLPPGNEENFQSSHHSTRPLSNVAELQSLDSTMTRSAPLMEKQQQLPTEGINLVPMPPISPSATIYHGNVRSGQQVSSEKGHSLIVLGSVNSGGEVLSDGDIMIFGKLRGKALAGLGLLSPSTDDDTQKLAIIIATSMDPELICIGSVLSTVDTVQDFGIPAGTPAMVSLKRRRSTTNDSDKTELVFERIAMA